MFLFWRAASLCYDKLLFAYPISRRMVMGKETNCGSESRSAVQRMLDELVPDDRLERVGTIPTRRRGTTSSWHEEISSSGTPRRNFLLVRQSILTVYTNKGLSHTKHFLGLRRIHTAFQDTTDGSAAVPGDGHNDLGFGRFGRSTRPNHQGGADGQ